MIRPVIVGIVVSCALLAIKPARAIGGVDAPPAPSAPRDFSFVKPAETRLANGLRVIVAERRRLPLVAAQLLIRSGAEVDPEGKGGAAGFTASLLTKGTETRSAPEIANAIESLGGSIYSNAGWDNSSAGFVVMSEKTERAFDVFADVVLHPAFKEDELERLRKQELDSLRLDMQEPASVADYVRVRVVFPEGEYAHPRGGTMETVQAITRDDVLTIYRDWYRPDNALLVLVGDINLDQGKALAEKYLGSWEATGKLPARPAAGATDDWKPRAVAIDMPQAGQAAVLLARPAIKRASPEYYDAAVTNAALGTGFASRLNREIRIKRGLCYGAGSSLEMRRDGGFFVASAQTKNESAPDVARLLQSEVDGLVSHPVGGEELRTRQAMLIGNYGRSMESNFGVAGRIMDLVGYDLPLSMLNSYIPYIRKVTTPEVTRFARKYLAQPMALIVVGNSAAFADQLRDKIKDLKVIPKSELDLNRPDLMQPHAKPEE